MSSKINHYFCETYRINYYFCLGFPEESFKKYMKSHHEIDLDLSGVTGRTIFNPKLNTIILWIRDKADLNTLVHECIHAGTITLESRGVIISHLNDEALAYLVESIFRKSRT